MVRVPLGVSVERAGSVANSTSTFHRGTHYCHCRHSRALWLCTMYTYLLLYRPQIEHRLVQITLTGATTQPHPFPSLPWPCPWRPMLAIISSVVPPEPITAPSARIFRCSPPAPLSQTQQLSLSSSSQQRLNLTGPNQDIKRNTLVSHAPPPIQKKKKHGTVHTYPRFYGVATSLQVYAVAPNPDRRNLLGLLHHLSADACMLASCPVLSHHRPPCMRIFLP